MSDKESIESLSDHEQQKEKSVSQKSDSESSPKPEKYEQQVNDLNDDDSLSNLSEKKPPAQVRTRSPSPASESNSDSDRQFGQKIKNKKIKKSTKKREKKSTQQTKKRQPKIKKGEENIKSEVYDNLAREIIEKMEKAYTLDKDANQNKKAAIHKMVLMPYVTSQLKKQNIQDAFLESGGLDSFAQWMQKLPDGSEPPLTLKRGILENLKRLNIVDKDQILYSKIGRIVFALPKKTKDEFKEIQKLASDIVDSWTQVITNTKPYYGHGGEIKQRGQL